MDIDDTLHDMVRKDSVRVPPYPSTAMKLQQVLASEDYGTADLVAAMRTDAVFTGNLLRLANSPFYRRGEPVTSLDAAVGRVGAKELTRLALAASVSSAAAGAGPLSELRRLVWRQSLTSALVCEALAQVDGGDPGEAFVAGLLHDAGKLLVLGALEDALVRVPGAAERPPGEWLSLVEAHHVAFGLTLAAKWNLPDSLRHLIAHHHDAPAPDASCARVARADAIVALLDANETVDAERLCARAGLDPAAASRLAQRLPGIPATIAAFEADAQGSGDTLLKPAPAPAAVSSSARDASLEPVSLVVEVRGAGAPLALDVRLASATRFVALSGAPLQVHRLLEFHVAGRGLSVWAAVQRARRLGAVYELECGLFAMSPALAAAWREVLAVSAAARAA